jgi:hypothetical protein
VRRQARLIVMLLGLLVLAAPRAALACPVCFGQNDSPLAWAVNVGVFVMLGFVVVVLTAFASFMVYLARRARRFASTPQEGIAQC